MIAPDQGGNECGGQVCKGGWKLPPRGCGILPQIANLSGPLRYAKWVRRVSTTFLPIGFIQSPQSLR
ncbi:MAG: hypothetical protein ACI9R3_001115 [Verrucomicrobiales bacterium]|jgi:hypothetical protein